MDRCNAQHPRHTDVRCKHARDHAGSCSSGVGVDNRGKPSAAHNWWDPSHEGDAEQARRREASMAAMGFVNGQAA